MNISPAQKTKKLKRKKYGAIMLSLVVALTIIQNFDMNTVTESQWFISVLFLVAYIDYRIYKLRLSLDILDKTSD